ncbi:Cupin domain-containing protein [Durusdinium trenchii]|uniref:Cupin domain-containing protein n=1 Tax=Durusdinium trenchii TaxID=1381693 RepID=A0ABP0JGB6_9DINO
MLKLIRKKHHDKHTSRKACLVIDWWAEWLQQTISHRSHHGIGPSLAGADASGGKFQGAWKPRTDLRTSSSIHICLKCRWVLSNVGDDVAKCTAGWNFWSSQHLHLQQRQQLEWQELTLMENESTGLTGGLLRLEPFKELPTHYHPEPYGEIYHFTRGNGHVTLHEYTDWVKKHPISPGLHVNIPARMLHGIEAGSEGCEFLWMFPARRWKAIPYLYVDPTLPDRNVPDHWVAPLPLGADAATWAAMRHRAAATNGTRAEL